MIKCLLITVAEDLVLDGTEEAEGDEDRKHVAGVVVVIVRVHVGTSVDTVDTVVLFTLLVGLFTLLVVHCFLLEDRRTPHTHL